jgi:hypothetical protein
MALLMLPALHPLSAQRADSLRAPDTLRVTRDTTRVRPAAPLAGVQPRALQPPISSRRAFLYSLALPGLGQSALRRPNAGALYFGLEILSIAMAIKSSHDLQLAKDRARDSVVLRYQLDPATGLPVIDPATNQPKVAEYARNRYDAERIRARRTHYEDWIAFLVFNHLFSWADAFVSAQLWDLPAQVGLQADPGAVGLSFRVRFR